MAECLALSHRSAMLAHSMLSYLVSLKPILLRFELLKRIEKIKNLCMCYEMPILDQSMTFTS